MKVQIELSELNQWKTIISGLIDKNNFPEKHKEIDETLLLTHLENRINAIINRKDANIKRKQAYDSMKRAQAQNNNSEYLKQKKIYDKLSEMIDNQF